MWEFMKAMNSLVASFVWERRMVLSGNREPGQSAHVVDPEEPGHLGRIGCRRLREERTARVAAASRIRGHSP